MAFENHEEWLDEAGWDEDEKDEDDEDSDSGDRQMSQDELKKLDELLRRAPGTLEHLSQLYNHYVHGVISKPPLEERARVEQMITVLNGLPKPTPSYRFRYSNVQQTYSTHKKLWDKLMADLESGKIKRPRK